MSIIFSIEVKGELKYKPFISSVIYITKKNISTYLKYEYLSFDVNVHIIINLQNIYAAIVQKIKM